MCCPSTEYFLLSDRMPFHSHSLYHCLSVYYLWHHPSQKLLFSMNLHSSFTLAIPGPSGVTHPSRTKSHISFCLSVLGLSACSSIQFTSAQDDEHKVPYFSLLPYVIFVNVKINVRCLQTLIMAIKVVLVSPGLRGSETELLDQSDISPKFFIQEHAEVTETSKAFPLSSHEVTSKDIVGVSASLTSRSHEESDDSGESLNVQVSFLFSLTFVF